MLGLSQIPPPCLPILVPEGTVITHHERLTLSFIYPQPNKNVFDVDALDVEKFANSFGLPNPPRLRFLKSGKGRGGDKGRGEDIEDASDSEDDEEDDDEDEEVLDKKVKQKENNEKETSSSSDGSDDERRDRGVVRRAGGGHFGIQIDGADEDEDLMTVKRRNHGMEGGGGSGDDENSDGENAHLSTAARRVLEDGPVDLTSAARARARKGKLRIKEGGQGQHSKAERTVFDDEGGAMLPLEALGDRESGPVPEGGAALAAAAKKHYDKVKLQRLEADVFDRAREKQRLRDMRDKNKAKERKAAGDDDSGDDGGGVVAMLGGGSDDDDASNEAYSDLDDDSGPDDDSEPASASDDHTQNKRRKVDISVAGMATKHTTIESLEERAMRLLG